MFGLTLYNSIQASKRLKILLIKQWHINEVARKNLPFKMLFFFQKKKKIRGDAFFINPKKFFAQSFLQHRE